MYKLNKYYIHETVTFQKYFIYNTVKNCDMWKRYLMLNINTKIFTTIMLLFY